MSTPEPAPSAPAFSVILVTVPPPGLSVEGGGPFVKIDGRESLLRAVELFLNRENVKQIQVCFTPEAIEEAKRKYAPHLSFSGVKVATGGPRWMDQLVAASAKLDPAATHVVVHDAARPAVPFDDIDALLAEAPKHAAVTLTAPIRNPVAEVDEGGNAVAFHPASRYVQLTAPQTFSKARFDEIVKSKQDPHASTFHLLKGSVLNMRLNGAADTSLVKAAMNLLPKPKIKAPTSPFEEAQW